MSLRQRGGKPPLLPVQNGGSDANGGSGGDSAFSRRKKGKNRNRDPSACLRANLSLMALLSVVMGCSYYAIGRHHHAIPRMRHRYKTKPTGDEPVNHHQRKLMTTEGAHTLLDPSLIKDFGSTIQKLLEEQKAQLEEERKKQEEEFEKKKKELETERKEQEEELEKERRELKELEQIRRREVEEEKHADDKVVFQYHGDDWMASCEREAQDRLASVGHSQEAILQLIEDIAACVVEPASEKLVALNKEISFQTKTRLEVGGLLENYTCADHNAPMSEDIATHEWVARDGKPRTVHVKHERPASRIHVVADFIDDEECLAMDTAAAPALHKATVADGKGGSQYSDNRKAMQAGIRVHWERELQGDPIARLSRRVYDYTNHVLDLNIDEHGQEDLMSIQYFGRGHEDEHPDRYMPHCDGSCNGLPFHNGTRMATMVMYCTLPEDGGSTNFRNAGVHVKPEKGSAIFFSYMDPKTFIADDRFTEHSGCPVYVGDKKIVTQWIRLGVDKQNPWTSFNTLGIKMSDAREYE